MGFIATNLLCISNSHLLSILISKSKCITGPLKGLIVQVLCAFFLSEQAPVISLYNQSSKNLPDSMN